MAYSATKPAKTAPFKDYLNYYMDRVGLSQNKLAICARINQSRLNKIYNGAIKNVGVETLVCICLALGLNEDETRDLLARQERAFSPAEPDHQAYLELIRIYSKKEIIYDTTPQNLSTILEDTDACLREKSLRSCPTQIWTKKRDRRRTKLFLFGIGFVLRLLL